MSSSYRKICKIGILAFSQLIYFDTLAQDPKEKERHVSQNIDSLRILKYEGQNFKLPSYSPELEVLVSAGG